MGSLSREDLEAAIRREFGDSYKVVHTDFDAEDDATDDIADAVEVHYADLVADVVPSLKGADHFVVISADAQDDDQGPYQRMATFDDDGNLTAEQG